MSVFEREEVRARASPNEEEEGGRGENEEEEGERRLTNHKKAIL